MASLLASFHFWTAKENLISADSSDGIYSYHGKNVPVNQQQQLSTCNNYNDIFKSYCEERGIQWSLPNKRPTKLRDNLKEVEELLTVFKCVYCEWKCRDVLLMMLNNGALIKFWMKSGIGDVSKIRTDKYLVGKLSSDHIVDVIFLETTIIISHVEAKLTVVRLNNKLMCRDNANVHFEKLSSLDAKLTTVELSGPNRRRFERRLSSSIQNDQLLIWWMTKNDEMPGPWAPPSTDREKANLHVYSINKTDLQLLCYTRTKFDPIWASFSRLHLNQIHTVEQSVKDGEITVVLCVYDILKNRLQRSSMTTIPLSSSVLCHGMNQTEDRSLLGCKDGSLVMYDAYKRTTQITKGGFVPSVIGWHPSCSVVIVGGDEGHLQAYDMALNTINIQLLNDQPGTLRFINLSTYFKSPPAMQKLVWNPLEYSPTDSFGYSDNTHTMLIYIKQGPIGVIVIEGGAHNRGALTVMELVTQYVKFSQFDEAINLLLNLNWNIESELCFKCLNVVMLTLLKLPLNDSTEFQLELSLGCYYSSSYQLSDIVCLEYRHKVTCLARKFFHHLLRNGRFEKAFLLAVDIGARDLFMDLHYIAKDKNESVLSEAALERANQLQLESDSSSVGDEIDSISESCSSAYSSSSCDSEYKNDYRANQQTSSQHFAKIRSDTTLRSQEHQQIQSEYQINQRTINNSPAVNQQPTNISQQPSTSSYTRASSHAPQVMSDISEEISEEEDGNGTVHVIHFGIV